MFAGQASKCIEILSVDDSVTVTHQAACRGGFKRETLAEDICVSATEATDAVNALLPSPYDCAIATGAKCRAFDATQTTTIDAAGCQCRWGADKNAGRCMWTGSNTYEHLWPTVKDAIAGSYNCHFMAFWPFLQDSIFHNPAGGGMPDFTSWFRCINDTNLLMNMLGKAESIWHSSHSEYNIYQKCFSDPSLNIWDCRHYTNDDKWCFAAGLKLGLFALLLALVFG